MTAAHKYLPLPTHVKVTNLENDRWVIVRVNDRGPFPSDFNASSGERIIDLPKDFFLKEMVRRKCKYGVSSACIGSGLGIAVVWENLTI